MDLAGQPALRAAQEGLPIAHALLTSIRNEGPYLVEWLAHNRVLGFEAIFVASNDSDDGSDALLAALAGHGIVGALQRTVADNEVPQRVNLAALFDTFRIERAAWAAVLDVDEFVTVATDSAHIADLTGAAPVGTDVIMLTARTHGSGPDADIARPVTARFPGVLRADHPANLLGKSLTRGPGRFHRLGVHTPAHKRDNLPLHLMRSDGSLRRYPPGFDYYGSLRAEAQVPFAKQRATIEHFAVRSAEEFAIRLQRGQGGRTRAAMREGTSQKRHSPEYFANLAGPVFADALPSDRYSAAAALEAARLRTLAGVADAEAASRAIWAERIAALPPDMVAHLRETAAKRTAARPQRARASLFAES